MKIQLIAGLIVFLILACQQVSSSKDFSSSGGIPNISVDPFDDIITKDCNYCHSLHSADNGRKTILNDREDRYSRYLDNSIFTDNRYRTPSDKNSRKCPRSSRVNSP